MELLHSKAFESGGMYILRADAAYVLFVAHKAGVFGTGAHKHNDWLSFEWCHGKQAIIVDPGTGCYTGDLEKKARYRKTSAHNTVVVNGDEQIPVAGAMFALPRIFGEVEVDEWQDSELETLVSAKHTGYTRLSGSLVHHRTVVLNKATYKVTIEDRFTGTGSQELDWYFHLDPVLEAVRVGNQFIISDSQKEVAMVNFPDSIIGASVMKSSVSYRYNEELDSQVLHCKFVGENYSNRTFTFCLCPDIS